MSKAIRIILIILVIAAIALGVSWLLGRRSAERSGTKPLSFREFITGDTGAGTPVEQTPGELSSEFTQPERSRPSEPLTPSTRTSVFTNTGLAPAGERDPERDSQGQQGVSDATPPRNNSAPGTPGGQAPSGQGVSVVSIENCSEEDLNITFTQEELNRIKTLQTRFYAIADTLYTEENVTTEESNREAFRLKANQFEALYKFCSDTVGKVELAHPEFTQRTATPFWFNRQNPIGGAGNVFLGYLPGPYLYQIRGPILPGAQGVELTKKRLEGALRLNLW